MIVSRRALLLGTAGLLAACGTQQATDRLAPVAGPDQQPGEPLWSPKTNSFLVGLTDADRAGLIRLGPEYVAAGSSGFVALLNQCTYGNVPKGTVGWCPSTGRFTCSICGSYWSRVGAVEQRPTTIGLTLLGVSVSADNDVIINVRDKTPGNPVPGDEVSTLHSDLSCARIYGGTG